MKRKTSDRVEAARKLVVPAADDAIHAAADRLGPLVHEAADRVGPLAQSAADRVGPLAQSAAERVAPLAQSAIDRVGPYVEHAVDRVGPYVETAVERVGPYAKEAKKRGARVAHDAVEALAPRLDDALDRVAPAVDSARERMNEDLLPKVSAALGAAAGLSVKETRKRGKAAIKAAKRELVAARPKKKGRWVKRIAIVAVIAGVAAVVVKKLLGSSDETWQAARPSAPYAPKPAGSSWADGNGHRAANDAGAAGGQSSAAATAPADDSPTEEIAAVADEPVAETLAGEPVEAVADADAAGAVAADAVAAEDEPESTDEAVATEATGSDADAKLRAKYSGEGVYVGAEPPEGFTIKGNERSMKYHLPEAGGYNRTIAEVWFSTEEAAQAAGFVRAQR